MRGRGVRLDKVCVFVYPESCIVEGKKRKKESRRVQRLNEPFKIIPSDRHLHYIPPSSRIASYYCPCLYCLYSFVIHQDINCILLLITFPYTPFQPTTCSEQLLVSRLFLFGSLPNVFALAFVRRSLSLPRLCLARRYRIGVTSEKVPDQSNCNST